MDKIEKYNIRICLIILCGTLFIKVDGQNVDKHKWQNRILIVKTSNENDSKYKEQLKEFNKSISGMEERKLILYQIVGEKYKTTDYEMIESNNSWKDLKSRNNDIIDDTNDFEVVLIGLDGGVKIKKREVLRKEELYNLIDRMPMRLEELRNNKRNGN
jgi:hypothetical protein